MERSVSGPRLRQQVLTPTRLSDMRSRAKGIQSQPHWTYRTPQWPSAELASEPAPRSPSDVSALAVLSASRSKQTEVWCQSPTAERRPLRIGCRTRPGSVVLPPDQQT